jgi:predicted molibdopterin-dependent oxidoreductase YjgC
MAHVMDIHHVEPVIHVMDIQVVSHVILHATAIYAEIVIILIIITRGINNNGFERE